MSTGSVNILVGGEAGQGLATIGQTMAKMLVRSGYEVCVTQEYLSRIRGGHNTFAIRTGPEPVHGPTSAVDILVALDQESVELHKHQLTGQAVVITDQSVRVGGHQNLQVPFEDLADKKIHHNTVALGVLGGVICGDIVLLEELLTEAFAKKGDEVVQANLEVLRRSFDWVGSQNVSFACMPPPPHKKRERLMLNGNEAIALGALAAGCNFCSFYPMTPSTSVALTLIAKGKELGFVSEQAEDEIAAINMALGASYAGARAVVTTSGGGFALMCEGVSLAAITETPVVIVLAQRPGPATGLPTRTEQGDLLMALHAGHGEFPRAILAPGTVEQCFWGAVRAFEMAERYQGPVILLTDQWLADCYSSVAPFELDALPEMTRPLLSPDKPEDYRRYEITEDGVSPRVVPGFSTALVKVDSDEHGPEGHIIEDPETRMAMNQKRLRKENGLSRDALEPDYYGDEGPDLLLVCWGSALGPCREAAERYGREHDATAGVLHFSQVWPINEVQYSAFFEAADRVVAVESNATGQFARLLVCDTGEELSSVVLRSDGLPLSAEYILEAIENQS